MQLLDPRDRDQELELRVVTLASGDQSRSAGGAGEAETVQCEHRPEQYITAEDQSVLTSRAVVPTCVNSSKTTRRDKHFTQLVCPMLHL